MTINTVKNLPGFDIDPAQTPKTLAALGGDEFMKKISATNIAITLPALSFDFPRANGVNACSIAFRDGKYHMALAYRFGWKVSVKARYNDLEADQLQATLLNATGIKV